VQASKTHATGQSAKRERRRNVGLLSRALRRAPQGFDIPFYHGTNYGGARIEARANDYDALGAAVWGAERPRTAGNVIRDVNAGGNIRPMLGRGPLATELEWRDAIDAAGGDYEMARELMKQKGLRGVLMDNGEDFGGTSYAFFDDADTMSAFEAFNAGS